MFRTNISIKCHAGLSWFLKLQPYGFFLYWIFICWRFEIPFASAFTSIDLICYSYNIQILIYFSKFLIFQEASAFLVLPSFQRKLPRQLLEMWIMKFQPSRSRLPSVNRHRRWAQNVKTYRKWVRNFSTLKRWCTKCQQTEELRYTQETGYKKSTTLNIGIIIKCQAAKKQQWCVRCRNRDKWIQLMWLSH